MRPRFAIPLIFIAAAIVYVLLTGMDEATKAQADPYLLIGLGLIFTACTLSTLVYTRSWTLRSAGVLLTIAGDSVLYSAAGGRHFVSLSPAAVRDLTDLARACFYVGAPLLFVGLISWIANRHRDYEVSPVDPVDTERMGTP